MSPTGVTMFLRIAKLLLNIADAYKTDLANNGRHGNACGPCYPLIRLQALRAGRYPLLSLLRGIG
jgi:hypothetical protein